MWQQLPSSSSTSTSTHRLPLLLVTKDPCVILWQRGAVPSACSGQSNPDFISPERRIIKHVSVCVLMKSLCIKHAQGESQQDSPQQELPRSGLTDPRVHTEGFPLLQLLIQPPFHLDSATINTCECVVHLSAYSAVSTQIRCLDVFSGDLPRGSLGCSVTPCPY